MAVFLLWHVNWGSREVDRRSQYPWFSPAAHLHAVFVLPVSKTDHKSLNNHVAFRKASITGTLNRQHFLPAIREKAGSPLSLSRSVNVPSDWAEHTGVSLVPQAHTQVYKCDFSGAEGPTLTVHFKEEPSEILLHPSAQETPGRWGAVPNEVHSEHRDERFYRHKPEHVRALMKWRFLKNLWHVSDTNEKHGVCKQCLAARVSDRRLKQATTNKIQKTDKNIRNYRLKMPQKAADRTISLRGRRTPGTCKQCL